MTTMRDLVNDCRRQFQGGLTDEINTLAMDYQPGDSTIRLRYTPRSLAPNTTLSCGLNTWYVVSVDSDGLTASVIPSYDGGPDVAAAAGDIVRLRPRVTDFAVFSQINDEIVNLSTPTDGLYRVRQFTMPVDFAWNTYVVPAQHAADMIGLLRVRFLESGSQDTWRDVQNWTLTSGATDSTLDTGKIVRVQQHEIGTTDILFTYKAPFAKATAMTDDVVTVCGLADTMTDIPPLGAAASILWAMEGRRNQITAQGDPRRLEEVPAGANTGAARSMMAQRESRVAAERTRLNVLYPTLQRR